jgi:DNA replication protein DnaC
MRPAAAGAAGTYREAQERMNDKPCSQCGDTGWVVKGGPAGTSAARCACFDGRRAALLIERAHIPQRYQDCSFDNFKPSDPSQTDALKISKKFAANYPDQNVGLLLIGPCGVGKTHLAVAMIRELIVGKGAACLFYDFRDLLRDIRSTFSPDSDLQESDVLAPVFDSRVLVLDELGAQRSSAWVEDTVFYIINHRYNQKRLTIFTSNFLDAGEVEAAPPTPWKKESFRKDDDTLVDRIGVRLRSRIYEMCKVVSIEGKDFRQSIKQAGYRF